MVEKNVAYNRDNRSEEFADNDPLAQLARLVAQEDRPAHVAPPVAASPAGRREPEFNLEDELLREFAIYDAPRHEPLDLDPANDVHSSVPANEFLQRVESVFARREPELEPAAPPAFEPVEQYAPAESEDYLIAEHAAPSSVYSDLRNDFSDDPDSVAAVFDVNHRGAHQQIEEPVYQPVAEPVYEEPVYEAPISHHVAEPEPVQHYAEPVADVRQEYAQPASVEPVQQPNWEQMAETSGEAAIDLASELEMSVADVPAPVQPIAPSVRRSSLEFSSLRLPLANFGATRPIPTAPRPATPVAEAPAPAPIEPAPIASVATPHIEAPVSHVEPVFTAGQTLSAMDELIYDVAKYEISNNSVSAAEPVAHMEPVATAAPVIAPIVETIVKSAQQQPVRSEPSFEAPVPKSAAVDDFDAFKDEDFELALDDIDFDLDLSEIANIDVPEPTVSKAAVIAAPAAVAPAPVQPKPVVTVAPVASAPIAPRPQPVAAPVVRQEAPRPAAPVAPVPETSLESLPFDPTQIGETEDAPETITEMEVPELPVGVFEPKPAPRRHEEDLDIDTELAALFSPAMSGGLDRHKNAEGKTAERQPQPTQDEVDEFERALEQDFRRSMQEAAETRATAANSAPTNLGQQVRYENDDRGNGRRWFVPMAAAVGLILVGGGTYALMSGGSGAGSNGSPVIISADSEPTKVVPENPGGRVVPNQDKAVYDRVAGGTPSAPTQPALISTNEEPVDVVQRTLIPEQLPLEDEADQTGAMSTPVGETEDPRLLSPEEQQAQNNNGGSGVGVSPRKVRTMIVRPDGTLVAQEVPEPTPAAQHADRVEALAAPQPAQSREGAPAVIAASRVPVSPQPPAQAQPQHAASAPAATQTAAPMPASRPAPAPAPAAQPTATAVNQPNVLPAPPSQPAQETAAAPTPATNASSSGGYYIQIASLPSQADAQKSYQNLSAKFASVIGGRGVDIKAADIAGKGTFYRVRIPAGDKNEAAALCERFRSAGGSCLIAR